MNEHSHPADPVRREDLTVRANLKRKAVETQETPQQILSQELQGVRRNIRKTRQKTDFVHPLPNDRAFSIFEEY